MFSITISHYRFSPTLLPSIVALIVFALLMLLGFWQLDRAEEKRVIEKNVHKAQAQEALSLNEVPADSLLSHIYHRAKIEGYYDVQHQFLYDNRTHEGRSGYHVLTPFRLKDQDIAVIINRGWIPYNGSRDNIPSIAITESIRRVEGEIRNPSQAIVLSEDKISTQLMKFPVTLQKISLTALSEQLGYPLLPIVIELDKTQPSGFVREWQPYYGKIDKHMAYAVQWFSMAAILLFLYLKLNTKKRPINS